jgi:hypothetical protein
MKMADDTPVRTVLRDENGQPFLLCPKCGRREPGWNQTSKPCPICLKKWLEEHGVPIMRYGYL